ncbi:bacterial regulatory helix-turn-helix, lysR family protein [Collimonas arenae]|uniref:Bacterial regulatory helix-turn-helix, lysR family protein n=1 Tax=Collimonas arenae TaxID=279058 RepID=A0A127QD41_9BURK|nr:LysR family transcriptional regulator [Collimonas arenae]AMP07921.1 bacterial regulatory helix-turn-helix, lysR family protein [Collimonas arenae]
MDQIKAIRGFVRAVELGSLSAVAREQHTTQPTVSKMIAALEKELGVRLLERSTTSLTLTDQGKRFYERSKRVLEEFSEAVSDARGLTEKPAGQLRVNAPLGLGQLRLNALVLEFLALYPDIEVELILNDRFVDLVEDGVDVALRLAGSLPPNVIARKIAASQRYLVAAPAYLERYPEIRSPADLASHRYIGFARPANGEVTELSGPGGTLEIVTRSRYQVNSSLAIRESFLMGAGLGICPSWLVHDLVASGQLRRVLPEWSAAGQEASLLYPSRRYQSLRATLFMQFLAEKIPQLPGFTAPSFLR